MKNLKFLFLLITIYQLLITESSAQSPPDTVNGWSLLRIVGNQSAVTYSRLMPDTATEGRYGQAFYFSLPPNTYVEWRKRLDRLHATPTALRFSIRLNRINLGELQSVFLQFFVKRGDSLTSTQIRRLGYPDTTYGWNPFDPYLEIDTANRVSFFDELVLKFSFNPPSATGYAEVGFDNLRAIYFNGVTIDSIVQLDRFGDTTITDVHDPNYQLLLTFA